MLKLISSGLAHPQLLLGGLILVVSLAVTVNVHHEAVALHAALGDLLPHAEVAVTTHHARMIVVIMTVVTVATAHVVQTIGELM